MKESVLMTVKEAADYLGISLQRLRVEIQHNLYPEFARGTPPGEHRKHWNYTIFRKRLYDFVENKNPSSLQTDSDN